MMVNLDEIYQRINEIKEGVDYLKNLDDEALSERDKFLLGRYYLQMILEALFAIGNQIIADHRFRKPSNYRDILSILSEEKIISHQLLDNLSPFAEMRNRLVHTYWKISREELLGIKEKSLPSFENFIKAVLGHIE